MSNKMRHKNAFGTDPRPRHVELTIRDGRRAIIYATGCGGDTPVHGAILSDSIPNRWINMSWTGSGRFTHGLEHHLDLIGLENNT